jgi:hypothetical protein
MTRSPQPTVPRYGSSPDRFSIWRALVPGSGRQPPNRCRVARHGARVLLAHGGAQDTVGAALDAFFSSGVLARPPASGAAGASAALSVDRSQSPADAYAASRTKRIRGPGPRRTESPMPQMKKAHCPAPGAVATACRDYCAATQPQSLAKAGAVLIAEGIAFLSEARQDAPKLVRRAGASTRAWLTRSRRISRLQCASRRATSSGHAPLPRSRNFIWRRCWAA